jgi:hypothetical protein
MHIVPQEQSTVEDLFVLFTGIGLTLKALSFSDGKQFFHR